MGVCEPLHQRLSLRLLSALRAQALPFEAQRVWEIAIEIDTRAAGSIELMAGPRRPRTAASVVPLSCMLCFHHCG